MTDKREFGGECPPEEVGLDPDVLRRTLALIQAQDGGRQRAQLVVRRHGRVVVDRAFGCAPHDLFLALSAGKPLTALLVHLLAERGMLRLDDPVAAHWPDYARRRKDGITLRHVLQHRAGVPLARGSVIADATAMTDWAASVAAAAAARPRYPAGERPAYHILTFGFILGEVVRRVTGTPVERLLRTEILGPWGLRDTHLGLAPELLDRAVPVRAEGTSDVPRRLLFNRAAARTAVIPAANVSTTAADLALLYEGLLRGGELDGVRLLGPDTLAVARRPSSDGRVLDSVLKRPIRWSEGFQLGGGNDRGPGRGHPMGRLSGPQTFGHNGSNTCNAWADPARGLVVAYTRDLLVPRRSGALHQQELSDTLLAACH